MFSCTSTNVLWNQGIVFHFAIHYTVIILWDRIETDVFTFNFFFLLMNALWKDPDLLTDFYKAIPPKLMKYLVIATFFHTYYTVGHQKLSICDS